MKNKSEKHSDKCCQKDFTVVKRNNRRQSEVGVTSHIETYFLKCAPEEIHKGLHYIPLYK